MRERWRHLNVGEAMRVFERFPNAVLMRSEGMGFFDIRLTREIGLHTHILAYRTCEALSKRKAIVFRDRSNNAGYWIKGAGL